MRSTLAMDNSLFPLDPSLDYPSYPPSAFPLPNMDLQYILSPLDGPQQLQLQHQAPPPHAETSPAPPSVRRPPEHVHPNPDDAIISFDSKTRSFPKPPKPPTPAVADPYAEDFLRDTLGPDRWETFSSRLFERRLGCKVKNRKSRSGTGDDDDARSGVSAIEFLVKVELVKEILRTYVPHPYNPLKSLTHSYPRAPSGQVTLTRSTVLLLSGWSNTQFSYWARRAEAVSVLADHDPRLRVVGAALERRLRDPRLSVDDDRDDAALVTGKGLDAIVDDVKKRTGKSQFLRGKHSSLDPYGTALADLEPEHVPPPVPYAMPTFQAERYDHGTLRILDTEPPPSMGPRPPPVAPPAPPKRRVQIPMQDSAPLVSTPDHATSSRNTSSPAARKPPPASDTNAHHFPVSDSRSEVESGGKRKPGEGDASSQKRARPF